MSQAAASQGDKFKEYKFVRSLGKGSYGKVDLVECEGKFFALKTMNSFDD